jgi:gas vesicle protein
MKEQNSCKKVTAGVLAGMAMGIIIGILMAPKKGKELRADLKKSADIVAKDIAKKITKLDEISKKKYEEVIDEAIAFYKKVKKMGDRDIAQIKKHFKGRWPDISKGVKAIRPKTVKTGGLKTQKNAKK